MYAVIWNFSFDLSIHDAFNTSQLHAYTSLRHTTIRGIVLDKKTNDKRKMANWN